MEDDSPLQLLCSERGTFTWRRTMMSTPLIRVVARLRGTSAENGKQVKEIQKN
jgi:hypothetical protein